MQFTATYRQTTKNRRKCMICRKLIQDGELFFWKRTTTSGGNAVHDACRNDTGGDWFARDCAANYVRERVGGWKLVTDYALQEKHSAIAKEKGLAEEFEQLAEAVAAGAMTEEAFKETTKRFKKSKHGYTLEPKAELA